MKSKKLYPQTIFSSLKLPYSDVILEEVFFLPIEAENLTLKELSNRTGLSYNKVVAQLTKTQDLAKDFEWKNTKENLKKVKVVNLEKNSPSFLDDSFSKEELISFWHPRFKDELTKALQSSQALVFFSSDSKRAFSAVMYLRGQGYGNTYVLKET